MGTSCRNFKNMYYPFLQGPGNTHGDSCTFSPKNACTSPSPFAGLVASLWQCEQKGQNWIHALFKGPWRSSLIFLPAAVYWPCPFPESSSPGPRANGHSAAPQGRWKSESVHHWGEEAEAGEHSPASHYFISRSMESCRNNKKTSLSQTQTHRPLTVSA